MKLRLRIFLALACLLPALPLCAGRAQTPSVMTEEKALAVLAVWDKAGRTGKVEQLVPHLAEDIRLKVTFEVLGETKNLEMGREQFIAESKRGAARRLAYESKRQKPEVAVAKDGRSAMITSDIFEELTVSEGTIKTLSSEVFVLKLQGGKVVVASYYATMSLIP